MLAWRHLRCSWSTAHILLEDLTCWSILIDCFLNDDGQTTILAVKDLKTEDNVKIAARVVRHNRGSSLLQSCKFALDGVSGALFILVHEAEEAQLMAGRCFRIDDTVLCVQRVLKLEQRAGASDLYQSAASFRIWP